MPPQSSPDVANRLQATTVLSTAPVSRASVTSQANDTAAATYASQTYINTQDGLYALASYYQDQDLLNIPNSSVGQPNGVAALDNTGKVPVAQMPTLGIGYLRGPFGPTTVTGGSASNSPAPIADFTIGVQNITFRPLVFAIVLASCVQFGRPVIEARISDGAASYDGQTLVARGVGRSFFYDTQAIPVLPCPDVPQEAGAIGSFPPSTDIFVTLWLYDANGQTSTVAANGFPSAVTYLLRTAL